MYLIEPRTYDERRSGALQNSKDFAFETNYHTKQIVSTVELFQTNGYSLELIFICLEDPEIAIERVKDRVLAKGGHAVGEAIIRERFTKGLDLLDETFHRFNTVYIYLSKYKHIEGLLVLDPPVKKVNVVSPIPMVLGLRLPRLIKFVAENSSR